MPAAVKQALSVDSGILICKGISLEQQTGLTGYGRHPSSSGKNSVIHRVHSNNSLNLSRQ